MDQPRATLWSPVALRQRLPGALLGLPSGESSFTYGLFPPDVPLFAAVFTTTRRATRIIVFTSQSRLPFQVSMARSQTVRPVSSQLRSPRNATSTVLSSVPLFQPLSLSSTASANNPAPGGAAVFCFAGASLRDLGSSRFAGTLQESRPWHLGAVSNSRPPGGVP